MKTNDYVKFVIEQFVAHVSISAEEKNARKQQKKKEQELFSSKWFGVLPMALKLLVRKKEK